MTIVKRTCATCVAFNSAPEGDEPSCWNLCAIVERPGTGQQLTRQPGPADACDSHRTHEEDAARDAAAGRF